MGTCSLYLGSKPWGQLIWEKKEERLLLTARCPREAGWVYRVVLQTDCLLPLGVMLPEGEDFVLRKTLYTEQLPQGGYIDRMLPGETHLPGLPVSFSAFERNEQGFLCAEWIDTSYMLFPLQLGKSCEMAHLLCIVQPLEHKGEWYGLFCKRGERNIPLSDTLRSDGVIS